MKDRIKQFLSGLNVYRTEEEQIDRLRSLWDQYGLQTVAVLVVGSMIYGGMTIWNMTDRGRSHAASTLYSELLGSASEIGRLSFSVEDSDEASEDPSSKEQESREQVALLAQQIKGEFSDHTYGVLGAFFLARLAVDAEDYDRAESQLQWVIENAAKVQLRELARLRLARVSVAHGDYERGLALLNEVEIGVFDPTVEEIRGDIYWSQGKLELALSAYRRSIELIDDKGELAMVRIKRDDLNSQLGIKPDSKDIAGNE